MLYSTFFSKNKFFIARRTRRLDFTQTLTVKLDQPSALPSDNLILFENTKKKLKL